MVWQPGGVAAAAAQSKTTATERLPPKQGPKQLLSGATRYLGLLKGGGPPGLILVGEETSSVTDTIPMMTMTETAMTTNNFLSDLIGD